MDHTAENIGHIASALYAAFRTVRVVNDEVRQKHRFVVGVDGNEQTLTIAHLTLQHRDWSRLEGFAADAIAALRRGAVEVAVKVDGVRIVIGKRSQP
jgi:hypothetical protein